jgi:hypothetical protein
MESETMKTDETNGTTTLAATPSTNLKPFKGEPKPVKSETRPIKNERARKAPQRAAKRPPSKSAKTGRPGSRGKPKGKPERATEAVRLVQGLQASWRDAVEAHRLRVDAQFRALSHSLSNGKRLKTKDIERAQAAVKIRIKPKKGRAKDLRHVEAALDKALSRIGGP